ncbi:UNVERIFIED_CONTAM: hypothetical protein GTU68_039367 [Idotea baltica]|nr:hypothetical protein [Idotea baltica]
MVSFDTIYLEGGQGSNEDILVSPETIMTLFTLQCCQDLNVKIVFTNQAFPNLSFGQCFFKVNGKDLSYKHEYLKNSKCPKSIQDCLLPAIFIENEPYVIVGLSASLRHFLNLKANVDPNHLSNRLLGFRKGCLQACAEVSVWTKFCEIEVVEMLKEIYFKFNFDKEITFPSNIIRFERHLECPPILHNALKRKQENIEKVTSDKAKCIELKKKKLYELPNLEHKYAEGVDLTLADFLLFVSFSLCMRQLGGVFDFNDTCPLVVKWLANLEDNEFIMRGKMLLESLLKEYSPLIKGENLVLLYPEIPHESLYKSDPNRYKPRWRSFTHQKDIDEVTDKLGNIIQNKGFVLNGKSIVSKPTLNNPLDEEDLMKNLTLEDCSREEKLLKLSSTFENELNWESFPQPVCPSDGDLPLNRLKRKCQQLESLAQAAIAIAKEGDVIVDFCAGGGHLGILLAYCLPNCKVLLVENKNTSLRKAYKRVNTLKLTNVYFYECNLDYFYAKFDIGVSLHACGVATDLVMQKCFLQKASFICCPCCYGSLRPNHILNYPRSSDFSLDFNISLSDYMILGHAADQTHDEHNPKTEQGKKCMQYVDLDRLCAAQKLGYGTLLNVMNPPECTPKNHILIGLI